MKTANDAMLRAIEAIEFRFPWVNSDGSLCENPQLFFLKQLEELHIAALGQVIRVEHEAILARVRIEKCKKEVQSKIMVLELEDEAKMRQEEKEKEEEEEHD